MQVTIVALLLMDACADTGPAPGAAEIRLTKDAADVAKCQALGNIAVPKENGVMNIASAKMQFQNQAVGFGASAGLVTEGLLFAPAAGVAYRCPSAAAGYWQFDVPESLADCGHSH